MTYKHDRDYRLGREGTTRVRTSSSKGDPVRFSLLPHPSTRREWTQTIDVVGILRRPSKQNNISTPE